MLRTLRIMSLCGATAVLPFCAGNSESHWLTPGDIVVQSRHEGACPWSGLDAAVAPPLGSYSGTVEHPIGRSGVNT